MDDLLYLKLSNLDENESIQVENTWHSKHKKKQPLDILKIDLE